MIRLDNLTKVFDTPKGAVTAADHITMEVPSGEICILLGPSGCGKTTTLKMINRIIRPTSGKVFINGEDTTSLDTQELRRNIGYVIQQIGLFPNMTVEQNISVVPRLLGWSRKRQRERASEMLRMVAMDETFLDRYPKELSGGQQQRIGVARGLAADPPVLLMDEPFGAIDPINREIIQDEFLKMQGELKKTIMFVSHDIDEAVKMGDKIAIFREGRLEQYGSPDDVLARPVNDFVADFVGGDRELKRMRLIKVSEAAEREAPSVRGDDSLDHALGLMKQAGAEHIVVVDGQDRPLGMLRREDAEGAGGGCRERAQPLPEPVAEQRDLRTAVSRMFTYDIDWLAVVDGDKRFAGIVTQPGIVRLLGELREQRAEEERAA